MSSGHAAQGSFVQEFPSGCKNSVEEHEESLRPSSEEEVTITGLGDETGEQEHHEDQALGRFRDLY